MEKISVKTESLAKRCEVCHQTDCFDAINNHCSRCVKLTIADNKKSKLVKRLDRKWLIFFPRVFPFIGTIIGFTMSLIYTRSQMVKLAKWCEENHKLCDNTFIIGFGNLFVGTILGLMVGWLLKQWFTRFFNSYFTKSFSFTNSVD